MKKTKIASIALAALLLLAAFAALFVAAEDSTAVTPVYYPNGTVILSENELKTATDMTKYFSTNVADSTLYSISWNDETDRLKISTTKALVTDMIAVPKNLLNYTICADLYLTENNHGDNALFAMGINSVQTWSRSTYFQYNVYLETEGKYWMNNYAADGSQGAGKASGSEEKYELGRVVPVKIVVTPQIITVFYNDVLFSQLKTDKLAYEFGTGSPFFMQRQNTTLEVDNLVIYSGTGEPDYTKTMANQQPLTEPETEAPADTDPPATEPPATDPVQTDPQDSDTTSKPDDTKAPAGESSSESTSSAADDGNKKSGCGSVIGIGAVGVAAALGAVFAGASRRRRK